MFFLFVAWIPLLLLYLSFRQKKKYRLIKDLPTSKTEGVFIGLVELKGTAECEKKNVLQGYLSGLLSVYYYWTVSEGWEKEVTRKVTDSDGKTHWETDTESGSTILDTGSEVTMFFLKDETGVIRINPNKANLEVLSTFSHECEDDDPIYYEKSPKNSIPHSTGIRYFQEWGIPIHTPIYVLGHSRVRDDVAAPEIAADPNSPHFLISPYSEDQIVRSAQNWSGCFFFFGLIICAITGYFGSRLYSQINHYLWTTYSSLIFLFIWGCFEICFKFNSLISLQQRVHQAWSNIDVELKRRADLFPNLIETVKAYTQHEPRIQSLLAEIRAQENTTAPGLTGTNPKSIVPILSVMMESCPNLKANEIFLNLQKKIINTENRIALARNYYNDLIKNYRDLLQVFPDNLLAKFLKFPLYDYLKTDEFQKESIHVDLE